MLSRSTPHFYCETDSTVLRQEDLTPATSAPRPGRPRSDTAGPALLAAARQMVLDHGYEAISISDIARAAGTVRQTLYRRWPSKAELILDAFSDHALTRVDSASAAPAQSVRDFLLRTFRALDETGPAMRGLMAHAQRDAAFCSLFRTRFIEPRRRALRTVLTAAQANGSLPADLDVDAAVTSLYGALWYRLLLNEPLDPAFADMLITLLDPSSPARSSAP
jgi:AcrR family transcriptional regulator